MEIYINLILGTLVAVVAYFLRGILAQFSVMNKTVADIDKKLEVQVYRMEKSEKDIEVLYSRVRELENGDR